MTLTTIKRKRIIDYSIRLQGCNITYPRPRYAILALEYEWTENFKEAVRNFYDNKSIISGLPEENGNALSIHHIDGDHENNDPRNVVPLRNKEHGKYLNWTEDDWENGIEGAKQKLFIVTKRVDEGIDIDEYFENLGLESSYYDGTVFLAYLNQSSVDAILTNPNNIRRKKHGYICKIRQRVFKTFRLHKGNRQG